MKKEFIASRIEALKTTVLMFTYPLVILVITNLEQKSNKILLARM